MVRRLQPDVCDLRRRVLDAYGTFLAALPEVCFADWDEGHESLLKSPSSSFSTIPPS